MILLDWLPAFGYGGNSHFLIYVIMIYLLIKYKLF